MPPQDPLARLQPADLARPSEDWERLARGKAFRLFQQVAERVPAYSLFLADHGVKARDIQTPADLQHLPVMDKANYLKKYPLSQLCWDGKLSVGQMISASSGSTGEPTFWPWGSASEEIGQGYYELILGQYFKARHTSTLAVMCFTLGNWIAGTHTLRILAALAEAGYPLTTVSPGIDKGEALKSIKHLAGEYEQILLIGYPPFIKDVIDAGELEGVNWKRLNVKMLFGGEAYSEAWRDYVMEKVGAVDPLRTMANFYAAADAGYLGVETPTSIAIRRLAVEDKGLAERLFESERIPSLQQYNPLARYFETIQGELILTTTNTIPLIRYNIKDVGGAVAFDDLVGRIGEGRLRAVLKNHNAEADLCTLPFMYVFGRAHNTATIYALNVYPENVRAAAEDVRTRQFLSGKVKLETVTTSEMDQYLHVTMELALGVELNATIKQLVKKVLIENLRTHNAEYNKLVSVMGSRVYPVVKLVASGDPTFKPGAKMARVAAVA